MEIGGNKPGKLEHTGIGGEAAAETRDVFKVRLGARKEGAEIGVITWGRFEDVEEGCIMVETRERGWEVPKHVGVPDEVPVETGVAWEE